MATKKRAPDHLSFTPSATPFRGIALVFDLAGFSRFFNEAGAQEYVPAFLNRTFEAVSICVSGGVPYWSETEEEISALEKPIHIKFLGDGALYVWRVPESVEKANRLSIYLCNRLFNLQDRFDKFLERASIDVPVLALPSAIRAGIACGIIYELNRDDGEKEYIGFPINLASKLQSYCPDLGLIVSAHIMLTPEILKKHNYKKIIATSVPGFSEQLVIVDSDCYSELPVDVKKALFRADTRTVASDELG